MSEISISKLEHHEFTIDNLPRGEGISLRVENFDVRITRTDEGVVVDVYDANDELNGDTLASAYAFDAETLSDQED